MLFDSSFVNHKKKSFITLCNNIQRNLEWNPILLYIKGSVRLCVVCVCVYVCIYICVCVNGWPIKVTLTCKRWELTKMTWFDKWLEIWLGGQYRWILSIVRSTLSVFVEIWPIVVRVRWVCWPLNALHCGLKRLVRRSISIDIVDYPTYVTGFRSNVTDAVEYDGW